MEPALDTTKKMLPSPRGEKFETWKASIETEGFTITQSMRQCCFKHNQWNQEMSVPHDYVWNINFFPNPCRIIPGSRMKGCVAKEHRQNRTRFEASRSRLTLRGF